MNIIYIIGGFISLALGAYLTVNQVKIFIKGKQDKFGGDIKLLGGGIGFIILGIALLSNFL